MGVSGSAVYPPESGEISPSNFGKRQDNTYACVGKEFRILLTDYTES